MKQIEINVEQKDRVYDDSILNKDVVVGKFLESFIDSKKSTPGKRGLSDEGVVNLRESTRHILMHCNPHDAVDNSETTHLVVGYVQSGKTMSFTALTAMALDNKYRLIIYLAGTKLNLLNQTTERLKKDLIGNNHFNRKFFKIHKDPSTDSEIEEVVGHLELSNSPIVLIPILKHYSHINRITDLVQNSGVKAALKNETVLIIDDEADQASLNSFGRSNSKKSEDEMSSTYDAILKLRASLPGNTYIQYTATPQANILISLQDLLSPKTHTLLTPGEGYVGGKLFFGLGNNHDLFNGALIKEIPQCQVYHKRYNPLSEMPESLKDALMFHILAVAISVMWFENVPFLSMMVHPSERKICNKKFFNWIEEELKKWRKNFNRPDGHIQKEIMINKFKEIFKYAIEFYDENERPSFDEIFHFIPDILKDRKTYL